MSQNEKGAISGMGGIIRVGANVHSLKLYY